MHGLVLADGRRWGDAADITQETDAVAVLEPDDGPRRHWIGRPRGYSKTEDVGGMLLAELVAGVIPTSAPAYAAAADRGQAALLLDSIAGFAERSGLSGRIDVQAFRAVHKGSGASVEVLAADAAGAYGLRPSRLVCDEVCQRALAEPALWRVAMTHDPAPWIDPGLIEAERRALTDSAFLRLWCNRWAQPDDALVSGDDLEAALRDDDSPIPPSEGTSYVLTLDVGTVSDRSVLVVAHREADRVI